MSSNQPSARGLIIFSIIILVLISILCIINYSISQTLNWSLYPIAALIMVWATIAPIVGLPQYKLLGSFIGLSFTLIPFLYMIANLSGDGEWFWPLALPLALCFLGVLGVCFAFLSRSASKWYNASATFFLFGVVLNYAVGEILRSYLQNQNIHEQIINRSTIFSCLLASFILAIIGYQRRSKPLS